MNSHTIIIIQIKTMQHAVICTYYTVCTTNKTYIYSCVTNNMYLRKYYTVCITTHIVYIYIIQFMLLTMSTFYTACVPDSLESHVGSTGPIELFVHRGNTHVLPVRRLEVVQHRVAIHRVGENRNGLGNFFRVNVKTNRVFEVVSLQFA